MAHNAAKQNWTIEQLGLRLHERGNPNEWNGLLEWFLEYASVHPEVLENHPCINGTLPQCRSTNQAHNLFQAPNVIGQTRLHCRGDASSVIRPHGTRRQNDADAMMELIWNPAAKGAEVHGPFFDPLARCST